MGKASLFISVNFWKKNRILGTWKSGARLFCVCEKAGQRFIKCNGKEDKIHNRYVVGRLLASFVDIALDSRGKTEFYVQIFVIVQIVVIHDESKIFCGSYHAAI